MSKSLLVLGLLLIVVAGYGLGVIIPHLQKDTPKTTDSMQAKAAQEVYPEAVQSNTLFFGNAYWGRYINDWSMASPLKYAYPFSRLNEFDRSKYDAWIAGLECPMVKDFTQTSAQEDATLSFNCSPDYLPEAKKWFTAFTLANNHTDNRGPEGFVETKQHLDEQGIQYFGHPDPRELHDLCNVIALPVTVTTNEHKTEKAALPVAMCGYHGFIRRPTPEAIAIMKEYSEIMPVIAMPHMGAEYKAAPDGLKQETYRAMIDNGADVVLGDHPHWVQTTEAYKGHLIVYSMGNFLFDQQLRPETTRSAAINVLFDIPNADRKQLERWLELGKSCGSYYDDCLARAKRTGLKKLPYTFQFSVVPTDDYGKIVKPADDVVRQGVLERLRWAETVQQLQPPYSAR